MVAKINSAQIVGLKTDIVEVEVDINRGLQSFKRLGTQIHQLCYFPTFSGEKSG